MNLRKRFETLNDNLKLDPIERAKAIEVHNRIGYYLVAAGIAKRTRLQGSFDRKTMLPPLKDIDKVIELAPEWAEKLSNASGPLEAMQLIQKCLKNKFPSASFEVTKHSLKILLPGDGFDFDAVPAINYETDHDWIKIADTENLTWKRSNTYQLSKVIADRNQICDGRFVRQVRMLKQAFKIAQIDLPGIHVEAVMYNAVTSSVDHEEALRSAFSVGERMLAGEYYDPTGVDRLDLRIDVELRLEARDCLQRLSKLAIEAQALVAAGKEDDAAMIWAEIFGAKFPPPDQTLKELNALHGGAGVSAAGTLSRKTPTPRTRAWRP